MFRQVACALVVIGSGDAALADALDKPAFAASATELLALANAAPAGDWPVVILREDNHIALDDLDAALKHAVQGVGPDKSKADSYLLNTLAAIEAERGDLAAAKADEWKAMEVGARAKPDSGDWYVVGRIAEQLGLREDAIGAYRRVLRRPGLPFPDSYDLAQRRLKKLQP